MKILYNQRQLKKLLILGMLYTLLGIVSLLTSTGNYLAGFIGIGIMYIIIYFVQKGRAYVTITANFISKDGVFPTKIEIEEITGIKYFAGDYIIKSSKKEIKIDTNLIDKESLPGLKTYFEKYITK